MFRKPRNWQEAAFWAMYYTLLMSELGAPEPDQVLETQKMLSGYQPPDIVVTSVRVTQGAGLGMITCTVVNNGPTDTLDPVSFNLRYGDRAQRDTVTSEACHLEAGEEGIIRLSFDLARAHASGVRCYGIYKDDEYWWDVELPAMV